MCPTDTSVHRVIFSLGSNVGDRLALLEKACDFLAEAFGNLRLSQLYETEPVGCPVGAPEYLNACVEAYTTKSPETVLAICAEIEQELGRIRTGEYGAPRTCDVDIIIYDELRLQTEKLTLPHPRAHRREFVLRPLCDLDASLRLPGQTRTVEELLAQLPQERPSVHPFDL